MASLLIDLITINGKLLSNCKIEKNNQLWFTNELYCIFPNSCRKSNFIQIEDDKKRFKVMFYTQGGFKITITDLKQVKRIKKIIRKLRMAYAPQLFQNEFYAAKFSITQTKLSIHPLLSGFPSKISYEKLLEIFPQSQACFRDVSFKIVIDHFQHETGGSYMQFKIFVENYVGSGRIYTNYKVILFMKNVSNLLNVCNAVSDLVLFIQGCCAL